MIEQTATGRHQAATSIQHKRALPSHQKLKFRSPVEPGSEKAAEDRKEQLLITDSAQALCGSERSEDEDNEDSEEEEMRLELERLRKSKEDAAKSQVKRKPKSRWRTDTPFQSKIHKQRKDPVHINDSIRNEKHRQFLDKYIS